MKVFHASPEPILSLKGRSFPICGCSVDHLTTLSLLCAVCSPRHLCRNIQEAIVLPLPLARLLRLARPVSIIL